MKSIREKLSYKCVFIAGRPSISPNFPTRPTRGTIVAKEEATREADRLQTRLADAAKELADLNIHCVEPAVGVAMIPFVDGDQLAWFVWELYAPEGIIAWRYHHDPLDMRRPLGEMDRAPLALTSMV